MTFSGKNLRLPLAEVVPSYLFPITLASFHMTGGGVKSHSVDMTSSFFSLCEHFPPYILKLHTFYPQCPISSPILSVLPTMESIGSTNCPCCKEDGKLTCTGCKNIKYCSVECQQCDWPTHKLLCKTFKAYQERPSEEMRRIIVFPPDDTKPKFEWRPVQYGFQSQTVDCEEFMKISFPRSNEVLYHPFTMSPLGYMLQVNYDDDFMRKYSEENKSIIYATGGKRGLVWSGPVFAIAGTRYSNSPEMARVKDMDMRTFSDLVAYLIDYFNETLENEARKKPKVTAVKANCIGEQRLNNVPPFVNVNVPASHPMFDIPQCLSPISERIGMPCYTARHGDAQKFTKTVGDVVNQPVSFMHRSCDPDAEPDEKNGNSSFGFPPTWWDRDVGNVLIARKDRKALQADTAEAFGAYCAYHIGAYNQWQLERDGEAWFKKAMLDEITPAKWTTFMEQWRHEKEKDSASRDGVAESDEEETINGIARMALNEKNKWKLTDRLLRTR